MSGREPSRYESPRLVGHVPLEGKTRAAYREWSERWLEEACAQGWAIFEVGCSFQVQKLDDPDDWNTVLAPEWGCDAVAWGFVYHGTSDLHRDTREFLKQHAPTEWALIEEACNGKTDTEGTVRAGAGADDGE